MLPTHRRRGLLTGMMRRLLDEARRRGEPFAGLWASESAIYGRFGFGWAATGRTLQVDTRHAGFRTAADPRGRIRLVDAQEAHDALPPIYERARTRTAGMLSRSPARWTVAFHDPDHVREGASRMFMAVCGDRGYARYRIKERELADNAAYRLMLEELVTVDDQTLAVLWRYLLDVDLVTEVRASNRPVDDPLPLLLLDPRRAVDRLTDSLWLRILDVPAVLAARRYPTSGRLVLQVRDAWCPEVAGTYLLDAETGGARCTTTSGEPDLTLDSADLAATYLGGIRLSWLARAGRVTPHRAEALDTADALFATPTAPWCPYVF